MARPGAVPHLLHHIAAGRASPQLTPALQTVLQERAADFSTGLSLDDARQTIQLLQGEPRSTVQALALQVLTAWAEAGQGQKVKLCSLGVAPVLGQLAMQAVALGDSERELQDAVCRWVVGGWQHHVQGCSCTLHVSTPMTNTFVGLARCWQVCPAGGGVRLGAAAAVTWLFCPCAGVDDNTSPGSFAGADPALPLSWPPVLIVLLQVAAAAAAGLNHSH